MKMRLLVFLSLIPLVLVAPVSNAAVKAGSACTKQGAKQISGGKSFTCVKQGKKLVWNKGVAIKKPAAPVVAPPTPSPTPLVTGSPTPSATPQPEPSITKILFTPWSSSFAAEDMIAAALSKTSEYFGTVKPSNAYTLTIDPAITTADREWITKMLDYTNGAFSDVLQGRVKVFLGTTHQWSSTTLRAAGTWVGDPGSPYPCSNGVNDAYCADQDLALLIYSDVYKPNSRYGWDAGRRSTPAHELFHTVQFSLAIRNVPPDSALYIPRWLMEGSANFFGFYIVDKLGFDVYESGRRQQVTTNPNYRTPTPLTQYDNFNSDPYGIGQAASEYLIASVGFESFLNIWKFTKSEGSFNRGFAKAVGIEISEFHNRFEAARGSMKIGTE